MKPVRIGIVGIGSIGSNHTRNLLAKKVPGCELAAICDVSPAALAPFPEVKHFSSSREMIRSGLIDAILIAVPHYDHTTVGIDALQQGLHVLVEKPLSVHKADCQRLIAAHKNKRQVFAAMFDTRTEPRFIKLREIVKSGELGAIRRINWIMTNWFRSEAYYASSDWRATWAGEGGGMLVNQLPHDLDLFQWIFGLPKRVRAHCPIGKYHAIEVEDEINAILEFKDGATAILMATTGEVSGVDRREIVGERGRIVVYDNHLEYTRNEVPSTEFSRTTPERFGRPGAWNVTIPIHGTAERHVGIIKNFVQAIREGAPLIARAEEGIRSVELANAIILASVTDRTVELPLDAGVFEKFLKKQIASSKGGVKKKKKAKAATDDMSASFQ